MLPAIDQEPSALQEHQPQIHAHQIDQRLGSLAVELRRPGARPLQLDDLLKPEVDLLGSFAGRHRIAIPRGRWGTWAMDGRRDRHEPRGQRGSDHRLRRHARLDAGFAARASSIESLVWPIVSTAASRVPATATLGSGRCRKPRPRFAGSGSPRGPGRRAVLRSAIDPAKRLDRRQSGNALSRVRPPAKFQGACIVVELLALNGIGNVETKRHCSLLKRFARQATRRSEELLDKRPLPGRHPMEAYPPIGDL